MGIHEEPGSIVAYAGILSDGKETGGECVSGALGEYSRHDDAERISVPLAGGLKQIERHVIREVIRRCGGNKAAAARSLRVHRRTLYRLLQDRRQAEDESERAPRAARAHRME
jgi:DNA-binding NtrC family response regulator